MLVKTKVIGLMMAVAVLSAPMVWADNGVAPIASPVVSAAVSPVASDEVGEWHHGHRGDMFAKVLNLSDDQVKQLKEIRQKQRAALEAEIKKILTPEQFAGYMALKKERKLMHEGHHKFGQHN